MPPSVVTDNCLLGDGLLARFGCHDGEPAQFPPFAPLPALPEAGRLVAERHTFRIAAIPIAVIAVMKNVTVTCSSVRLLALGLPCLER